MTSATKLEVFELIAQDPVSDSYLAKWAGDTWIVLRRARGDEGARGIQAVEATATALTDANVVRTFDPEGALPELKGSVLLEEYVEGERLSVWLETFLTSSPAARALPWSVAAAIVRDAARGAHAVLQGSGAPRAMSELCPERLVVGYDGSVRIIDPCAELRGAHFDDEVRARYAAPELDREPGPACAVFSLGTVLAALLAHNTEATPKALERVLARSTAPLAERLRTPAELAAALDALLDDPEPVHAYFTEHFAEARRQRAMALQALGATAIGSDFTDDDKTNIVTRNDSDDLAPTQTLPTLPHFEDSPDTEELHFDAILGAFAADADEDARTRPFRRAMLSNLSKLKRTEQETLERGGRRSSVVPTAIPAAHQGPIPSQSVIAVDLEPPTQRRLDASESVPTKRKPRPAVAATLRSAGAMKKPKPTAALASETVVIRAVRPSRWREIVVLIAALLLVAGVALWVFK